MAHIPAVEESYMTLSNFTFLIRWCKTALQEDLPIEERIAKTARTGGISVTWLVHRNVFTPSSRAGCLCKKSCRYTNVEKLATL